MPAGKGGRLFLSSFFLGHVLSSCLGVLLGRVAMVEIFLEDAGATEAGLDLKGSNYRLQGAVLEPQRDNLAGELGPKAGLEVGQSPNQEILQGALRLVEDEDSSVSLEKAKDWIGVVPVGMEETETKGSSKQESFAAAVLNKMKRALVLGASALLILALNQSAIREIDVSQVLSKPVIAIHASENVTKLLGALLRGLRATATVTYKTIVPDNLGVTLTLWSTCGWSRGGVYGEWQGVICTGENSSQVQKYLQQLWNSIILVASVLCTGVILQARWQYRQNQSNEDTEVNLKQDILKCVSRLKTRKYHPYKKRRRQLTEIESCAVCLDHFHKNQVTSREKTENGT
ncbi:RING finger protein 215 isoform X1 [Latimeria chalumnae]|uniref:RING finger protein 215 isoform X1 n=1 Tax=Latimeria chalumnae TaxID=7897 RepID=UPI00313EBFAF